jgi:hypothetical protein
MGDRCQTCRHPEVEAINQELIENKPIRNIAERYGRSPSSIHRHSKNCIPEFLQDAREAKRILHGVSIKEKIDELEKEVWALIGKLDAEGDHRGEIRGFAEIRRHIELRARLGLDNGDSKKGELLNDPEWIELQTHILEAIDEFPEAKFAVILALEEYYGSAEAISDGN